MNSISYFLILGIISLPISSLATSNNVFEIKKKKFVSICENLSNQRLFECEVAIGESIGVKSLTDGCPITVRFKYSSSKDRQAYIIEKRKAEERISGYEQVDLLIEQALSQPDNGTEAFNELAKLCREGSFGQVDEKAKAVR